MKKPLKKVFLVVMCLCFLVPVAAIAAEETTNAPAPAADTPVPTAENANTGGQEVESDTNPQIPSGGEFDTESEEKKPINAKNTLIHNLIPPSAQQPPEGYSGKEELMYNKYPLGNYGLDLYLEEKSWWELTEKAANTGHYFLHTFNDAGWNIIYVFARFVIMVVENAFEFSLVENVSNTIGEAIQNIAGFSGSGLGTEGIWGMFLTTMIVLIGTWAAYMGMIRRETSRATSGIVAAILVLVCSLGFFANAGPILQAANAWSGEVQKEIIGLSGSIANGEKMTGQESYISAGNQLWDLMVVKPYAFLQFGTLEGTESKVNEILSKPALSKERAKFVEQEVEENENVMMSTTGNTQRTVFLFLIGISNFIIGVVVLMVSAAIIFYQLLFIVLALLAPIMLLMGLMPSWAYVAKNWVLKMVGAQLMKIALGVFLSILFGVSAILYNATNTTTGDKGYLFTLALQLVLMIGIIVKRRDIIGAVLAPVGGETGSTGGTMRTIARMPRQMYRKGLAAWRTHHMTSGIYDTAKRNYARRKDEVSERRRQKAMGQPDTLHEQDFPQPTGEPTAEEAQAQTETLPKVRSAEGATGHSSFPPVRRQLGNQAHTVGADHAMHHPEEPRPALVQRPLRPTSEAELAQRMTEQSTAVRPLQQGGIDPSEGLAIRKNAEQRRRAELGIAPGKHLTNWEANELVKAQQEALSRTQREMSVHRNVQEEEPRIRMRNRGASSQNVDANIQDALSKTPVSTPVARHAATSNDQKETVQDRIRVTTRTTQQRMVLVDEQQTHHYKEKLKNMAKRITQDKGSAAMKYRQDTSGRRFRMKRPEDKADD